MKFERKPFKSFKEFMIGRGKYPCLVCSGRGRITDPDDCPGPYDRPSKIKCPKCGGTGKGTAKEWRAKYQEAKEKHNREADALIAALECFERIKAKLTEEELKFLDDHGFDPMDLRKKYPWLLGGEQ